MTLVWTHDKDGESCPTVTLHEGTTWLCWAHGMQVSSHTKAVTTESNDSYDTLIKHVVLGTDIEGNTAPTIAGLIRAREAPLVAKVKKHRAMWGPVFTAISHGLSQMERESDAEQHVRSENASLKQVGWYCAGGHALPSDMHSGASVDHPAPADLQMEHPCEHAVPVFTLIKAEPPELPEVVWDEVHKQVGNRVAVHTRSFVNDGQLVEVSHGYLDVRTSPLGVCRIPRDEIISVLPL